MKNVVEQDDAPPKMSLQQANYIDIISSKDEIESITVSLKSPIQIEVGGQDIQKGYSKYEKSLQVGPSSKTEGYQIKENDKRYESEMEKSPAPRLINNQE